MIGRYQWRSAAVLSVAAVMVITSACSSSGNNKPAGSTAATTPSSNTTAPVAASSASSPKDMLPAAIKARGTIVTATESSYPPFVYAGPDGKTLVGVDMDLGNALGEILGVKFDWKVTNFDGIIPGVVAGRYDMSFDALTDTADRRKQQHFLDYVKSGSGLFVPTENKLGITGLDDTLCGHSIGVVRGTYEATEATDFAKKCTSEGKANSGVDNYPTEEAMFLALTSGRDDSILVSASVGNYTAKQSGDKFKQVGGLYGGEVVQGMTFALGSTQLLNALQAALQQLMDNGTYLDIMKKYDMESVALTKATINTGLGAG